MTLIYPFFISIAVLLCAPIAPASAATIAPDLSLCPILFQPGFNNYPEVTGLEISANPIEQWLLWEEKSNFVDYHKPSTPVDFEYISVAKTKVEIWRAENSDLEAESVFLKGNVVIWLQHRYNTSHEVPFNAKMVPAGKVSVRLTASRSVVIPELMVSLKLPTDSPHPKGFIEEPEKLRTSEDINSLRVRQNMIDQIDQRIGLDPELILLREPLAFIDPETGNGIVFRDLSPLADGHYYLPALSIPYVGNKLAQHHGQTFSEFWQRHYIEAIAKVKAKLLIRYGLQMQTPNPQNFLIQLDRNLNPTGRIVVRDFADSEFYGPVARAKGMDKEMSQSVSYGEKVTERLKPYFTNSIYLFNDSEGVNFSYRLQDKWEQTHDSAYAQEIERLLDVKFLKKSILPDSVIAERDSLLPTIQSPVKESEDFLTSESAKEMLRNPITKEYPAE